ncbi:MAG: LexA family protein [Ktedonobacterales bacterium]
MGGRGDMTEQGWSPHESGRGTPHRRARGDLRADILNAIETYWREHGRPPTIREIGSAVGIASTSNAAYHVTVLERQGKLSREPGMSRGLMSTRPAGLRILGTIAAGDPLEQFDDGESELLNLEEFTMAMTSVPVGSGRGVYALRVRGTGRPGKVSQHGGDGVEALVPPVY